MQIGLAAITMLAMCPGALAAQSQASDGATDIYRTAAPSVFLVEVRDDAGETKGIGSAFLIEGNRLVTNAHVVVGGQPYLRTGAVALALKLTQLDTQNDLAVLVSPTPIEARPLRLAAIAPVIGTRIFALGNPKGLERSISEGLISGIRERDGRRLLQITAAISPGSSGGPVVNEAGEVVGVTVGYLDGGQSLNFAIPTSIVTELLDQPSSASQFALAFAAARRIADQQVPHYKDTEEWDQYWESFRAALDRAAEAATTGLEALAVASLAADELEVAIASRLANRAVRAGLPATDSVRLTLINVWKWELIISDSSQQLPLARMLAVADTVVEHRPREASVHEFRARVLARMGQGRAAIAAARSAVETSSDDAKSSMYWKTYHHIVGEHGTATEDDAAFARLRTAAKVDGYDWASHAEHLNQHERWEEAGSAFAEAFRATDGSRGDYACRAGEAFWIGLDLDGALDALRACIRAYSVAERVDSGHVVYAHRALASILNSRGVYAQAETHARQALALDGENAFAALELSNALREQQRPTEAAAAAEAAIRFSDGANAEMHFAAGAAYFDSQEWSRCERAFRKADELNPKSTAAAYNTALCLANQGYYRDAARWMETVLRRDPNRSDRADIEARIRSWRR